MLTSRFDSEHDRTPFQRADERERGMCRDFDRRIERGYHPRHSCHVRHFCAAELVCLVTLIESDQLRRKRKWQHARKAAGKPYDKPNMVMNAAVQVCE